MNFQKKIKFGKNHFKITDLIDIQIPEVVISFSKSHYFQKELID